MKTGESMENYLETIYMLNQETGFVRSVDIATALGFSKPSVSNAIKKLKADNYVQTEEKGRIVLTEKGLTVAKETYEKHCVISALLMHLGVSEEVALEDACRMEHCISEETFLCMKQYYEKYAEIHKDTK